MQQINFNLILTLLVYFLIQDHNIIEAFRFIRNDQIEEYVDTCHNTLNLTKINWNFVEIFCTKIKMFEDQDNEVPVMDTYFKTSDNIEFRHCHGVLNMKNTKEFVNQCFRDVQLSSEWQKWLVQDTRNEDEYWRQTPVLRTISCYSRRNDKYTQQYVLKWYQEQLKCLKKQKGGFYSLLPNTDKKRHPVFE